MKYFLQPTSHKILVRIHELRQITDLQIVVPETISPMNPYGEVLAVGPDVVHIVQDDKVLFLPGSAIAVTHYNETLYFIDEGSVFGRYVEPEHETV